MYESSDPQFFRTTNGIQSAPDDFDESRFVITFLTNLGVIEILCNFKLFKRLFQKSISDLFKRVKSPFFSQFFQINVYSIVFFSNLNP